MLVVIILFVFSNFFYRVKVLLNKIINFFNLEICYIILFNCENFVVVFIKKKKEVKYKNDCKKFVNYFMILIGMIN